MESWVSIITTVGFPIVACIACGLYIKYQSDMWRTEREKTEVAHKDEMLKITEALNNNTVVMTKLCERLSDVIQ